MRKFKAAAATLGSCSAERLEGLEAETPGCEEEGHAEASTSNKGVPAKGFRLSTTQVSAQVAKAAAAKNEYDRLYIEATQEWAENVCSGKCSSHSSAAKAVAGKYMSRLPAGYKLTARMLYNAMSDGRCGKPPPSRGPTPLISTSLVEAITDYASLKQAAGDE